MTSHFIDSPAKIPVFGVWEIDDDLLLHIDANYEGLAQQFTIDLKLYKVELKGVDSDGYLKINVIHRT